MKKKYWYDYLWIFSSVYIAAGFFNIMFAWIGLLCFFTPLLIAIIGGSKVYCNKYCGRGQLLNVLGNNCKVSRRKNIPKFLRSKWFRYGFLIFFLVMFFNMLFSTYLVFLGEKDLSRTVTLLWAFKLPWNFAYSAENIAPWIAQFAFGFYSVMITSTFLGIVTMILFKPRSWCVYCPMGTMTQLICKLKNRKDESVYDSMVLDSERSFSK